MSTELDFYSYHSYFEESVRYWKSGLLLMDGALKSVSLGDIESHIYGIESIRRLYCDLYKISRNALSLMIVDWNILRECFFDVNSFDNYMKLMMEQKSCSDAEKQCEKLWKDGNVSDTSEISSSAIQVEGDYNFDAEDAYVVNMTDIRALDVYINALEELVGSAIPAYRTNINEFRSFDSFKGRLANASRAYIYEVHTSILDALESIAEVFCNLIKNYQGRYEGFGRCASFKIDISELRQKIVSLEKLKYDSLQQIGAYNHALRSAGVSGVSIINNNGELCLNNAINGINRIVDAVKRIENDSKGSISLLKNCLNHLKTVVSGLKIRSGYRILNYSTNDHINIFNAGGKNPLFVLKSSSPEYILSKLLTDNGYLALSNDDITKLLNELGIKVDVENNPFVYNGMARFYREYTRRGGSSRFAAEQVLKVMMVDPNLLSQYYFNREFVRSVNEGDAKYLESLRGRGVSFPSLREGIDDFSEEAFLNDIACHPMVVIPNAVIRADQFASDNRHGYLASDPVKRFGPYDYDCVSVVAQVYIEQGIALRSTEYTDPDGKTVLSTGLTDQGGANLAVDQIHKVLKDNGFVSIPVPSNSSELAPGDVLVNPHHAEIAMGHEQTVSASKVGDAKEGDGGWYLNDPGDQRIFPEGTLESVFNGEISRDAQVGNWHNDMKDWEGIDYLEDSHDYYDGTFNQVYRYTGRTGIARIDYDAIQSRLDNEIDYKDEYINRFKEYDPYKVNESSAEE